MRFKLLGNTTCFLPKRGDNGAELTDGDGFVVGKVVSPGEVVESKTDLRTEFPGRFEKVGDGK